MKLLTVVFSAVLWLIPSKVQPFSSILVSQTICLWSVLLSSGI
jgi:hypothetical protein